MFTSILNQKYKRYISLLYSVYILFNHYYTDEVSNKNKINLPFFY